MNGNASSVFQGAMYFPSQQVTFNGTAGMTTNCFQLVARRVYYSGTMNISNSCPSDSGAHDFNGKKVRLFALSASSYRLSAMKAAPPSSRWA